MRLAFWRRKDAGDWSAFRPLLFDQAGAGALNRLAAERANGEATAERSPRQQKADGPSVFGRARRILLPLVMLAFGGLVTAGMAYGAWITATDGDGLSLGDALRIAVIAVLSLMFLGQVLGMMRLLPGASWVASRFHRPLPPAPPLLLLDQVGASALNRGAPEDLGDVSRAAALRSRGRRLADLGSWVALVLLAVGVTLFIAAGTALGAWSAFWQGGLGFAAVVQIAFLLLAAFGVIMLAMMGLRGLRQRRQRRRKRLLRRLLRYMLRLFDSGRHLTSSAAGLGGARAYSGYLRHSSPFSGLSRLSNLDFGRALVLTVAVASLGFYPAFAGDDSGAGASGGSSSVQLAGSGGPGVPGGGGVAPVVVATPSPSPTPEDEDDDEELVAEAPDASDPPGGPGNLADPSSNNPTATFTPTLPPSPTPTFTPTPTPVPCVADVSETDLDFEDDATSLPLTISLNDCGGGPVGFVVSGSESWITPSPGGGTLLPGGGKQITVFVDRDGLAPDIYTEQLQIVSSLGNLLIPITVEVEAPPCEIEVSQTTLDFGTVNAPDRDSFEISLSACGDDTSFSISISRGAAIWLGVAPANGSLDPGDSINIDVSVDPGPMAPGPHSESLTISTDFGTFDVTVIACRLVPGGPPCR